MRKSLIFGCLVILFIGCTAESDKQVDKVRTGTVDPEFARDAALYHEMAMNMALGFARDFRGELTSAMSEGDAVYALKTWAKMAPEMAAAHSVGGWVFRRVSDRSRNPDNRASTTETVILLSFADAGTSPPFIQTWEGSDSLKVYRFFKPIHTAPLCLKCHGDLQTMAPGVMTALKDMYPQDRATGYKSDELIGMFVIEASWPDGKEHAEQLLSDSI